MLYKRSTAVYVWSFYLTATPSLKFNFIDGLLCQSSPLEDACVNRAGGFGVRAELPG